MELREKIARAISNGQDVDPEVFIGMHDRRSWERIYYPAADAILAIPELRVGLSDSKAVQAAIAEFEAKGMQSAKNILAWHLNEALNA